MFPESGLNLGLVHISEGMFYIFATHMFLLSFLLNYKEKHFLCSCFGFPHHSEKASTLKVKNLFSMGREAKIILTKLPPSLTIYQFLFMVNPHSGINLILNGYRYYYLHIFVIRQHSKQEIANKQCFLDTPNSHHHPSTP